MGQAGHGWWWGRLLRRQQMRLGRLASGILPTWTGYGKTVRTCLNMVQTCLYMYVQVHEFINVYVHVMYMYIM